MSRRQAWHAAGAQEFVWTDAELLAVTPGRPYFDQLVLDAIAAEVPQIVNLGAGYDDRALRLWAPGVEFFDLPDIIADKARWLEAMDTDTVRLTLVATNFGTDDVAEVPSRAGHDTDHPTLFVAEHLVLFLEPTDVERLITATSSRAARSSTLAITAEMHSAGPESDPGVSSIEEQMVSGVGPLHTIHTRDAWLALFEKARWQVKDADKVTAVNHFELPVSGQAIQIQRQFLTATA